MKERFKVETMKMLISYNITLSYVTVQYYLFFCCWYGPIAIYINFSAGNFLAGGIYAMPQLLDRYGLGAPIAPGTMVWAKRWNSIVFNLFQFLNKKTNLHSVLCLHLKNPFANYADRFF